MFGSKPSSRKKSSSLFGAVMDGLTPSYSEALKQAHRMGYSGDKARRVAKRSSTKWWK